jgi:hypothetical protein
MLIPTPEYHDITPLMQTRLRHLPGEPVFQIRTGGDSHRVSYPLLPMSPEAARGLPLEAIFELRGDSGEVVQADLISVDSFVIPPEGSKSEILEACRAAGVEPSGWMVAGFPSRTHDR